MKIDGSVPEEKLPFNPIQDGHSQGCSRIGGRGIRGKKAPL